jgi:hypothetical protein
MAYLLLKVLRIVKRRAPFVNSCPVADNVTPPRHFGMYPAGEEAVV